VGTDQRLDLGSPDSDLTYCARHPQVESNLRCGRCGTLICPRCLVQSPVGSRCPDCANVRRLPTVDVKPVFLVRGLGAAIASGAAIGAVWGYVVTNGGGALGFFLIFIAMGMGYCVSEAIAAATNRKRASALQALCVVGMVVAYFVHSQVGYSVLLPRGDLFAQLAAGFAAFYGAQRLKP
jgi:hypothetical protein